MLKSKAGAAFSSRLSGALYLTLGCDWPIVAKSPITVQREIKCPTLSLTRMWPLVYSQIKCDTFRWSFMNWC